MVSRTALVMAMPGMSSIMSPMDILSNCNPGRKCTHKMILTPTAIEDSRLNTMRLGQAGEKCRCK